MKHGRATCLPHKGGGVPLSALPKDTTSKLAGLFSTLFLYMLSAKQGSCEYHFLKSFGMTRLRNEPQVYRLQCRRSNHCTIAPVINFHRQCSLAFKTLSCTTEAMGSPSCSVCCRNWTAHDDDFPSVSAVVL